MSSRWTIAAVHCEACQGRNRRRDIAHLIRNFSGEEYFVLEHEKDAQGFDAGPGRRMSCPDHGPVDAERAHQLGPAAIEAHRSTKRIQHMAVPPLASM